MTLETIRTYAQARLAKLPQPTFKHGLRIRINMPHAISFDDETVTYTLSGSSAADATDTQVDGFFGEAWERKDDTQLHASLECAVAEQNIKHITIPKNQKTELAIEIEHSNAVACVCITAEEGSNAVITLVQTGAVTTSGTIVRVQAGKDATVTMIGIQKLQSGVSLQDKRAIIAQGATVHWFDVQIGADVTIAEIKNRLLGHDAQGEINAVFFTSGTQQLDLHTVSHHDGKHTHSNITTRGAIAGKGKALSRSDIEIGRDAPDSDGYEKQEAILLSADAEADAIPNLEIDNHEVKCSHGSTVGKLDELSVFYLMSRGINKHDAYQLMLEGFFEAILGEHAQQYLPEIREAIRRGLQHA